MILPHNDQLTAAENGKFDIKWDLANYLPFIAFLTELNWPLRKLLSNSFITAKSAINWVIMAVQWMIKNSTLQNNYWIDWKMLIAVIYFIW